MFTPVSPDILLSRPCGAAGRRWLLALGLAAGSAAHAQSTLPAVSAAPAPIVFPAGDTTQATRDLAQVFHVPGVTGPVARFQTVAGSFDIELLPAAAPLQAANFSAYAAAGAYDNTFFHRVAYFEAVAQPSILQGGGYYAVPSLDAVSKLAPVPLEYQLPNVRGTLAAARTSDPNSATSEWYFNTRDNSSILGPANDGYGYTVFARVLGTGMAVVDAIASLPLYNIGGPFNSLPLRDVAQDQTQVYLENLVPLQVVREIPVYPSADGQAALLGFLAVSDTPEVATALADGRTLRVTPVAPGFATIALTTGDVRGNLAQTTLAVTVLSPVPYVAWRQTNLATLADAGEAASSADPDADGLPNLLEYALGQDPLAFSSGGAPAVARDGSLLTLSFSAPRADLDYVVETTTALDSVWTTAGVMQGAPDANGRVSASVPVGEAPRFLRLRVAVRP